MNARTPERAPTRPRRDVAYWNRQTRKVRAAHKRTMDAAWRRVWRRMDRYWISAPGRKRTFRRIVEAEFAGKPFPSWLAEGGAS